MSASSNRSRWSISASALLATFAAIAGLALLAESAPALAAVAPSVTINSPTAVTSKTAHLSGTVNPHGGPSATTWSFEYSKEPVAEGWTTAFTGEFPEGSTEATATTPQPVQTTLEGLQPKSAYQFRLVATDEGLEASPEPEVPATTLAAPPSVDIEAASAVNSTAATLEAQINANNESTTYTFEYATSATLLGATKVAGEQALAETFGDQPATVPRIEGLTPGTKYFYRAVAENAQSKTEKVAAKGPIQEFTTVPTPTTDSPELLTSSTATLTGHFTPGPLATNAFFFYNFGTECTGLFQSPTEEPSSGTVKVPVAELQPNKEYSACLVTSNQFGSEQASPVPFKTKPAAPTVAAESVAAKSITSTDAQLEAKVNPNNEETSYLFEYSTSKQLVEEGKGTVVAGATLPAEPFEPQLAGPTDLAAALAPRTTYFYRVVATNVGGGSSAGATESFETLATPLIVTGPAVGITRTTANLSGNVNPEGAPTSYDIAYIDQARYEEAVARSEANPYARGPSTPKLSVGSDFAAHALGPVRLQELTPGTTYHYAVVATNSVGTTIGPDMTFTTSPATPPIAVTGDPVDITRISATLTGAVDTRGLQTQLNFEFGRTPALGSVEGASVVPGTQSEGTVGIVDVFGNYLQPGTTYYYRTVATNVDGTGYGAVVSFTTGMLPEAPSTLTQLFSVPAEPAQAPETKEKSATKPKANKCKKGSVKKHGKCVKKAKPKKKGKKKEK